MQQIEFPKIQTNEYVAYPTTTKGKERLSSRCRILSVSLSYRLISNMSTYFSFWQQIFWVPYIPPSCHAVESSDFVGECLFSWLIQRVVLTKHYKSWNVTVISIPSRAFLKVAFYSLIWQRKENLVDEKTNKLKQPRNILKLRKSNCWGQTNSDLQHVSNVFKNKKWIS